MSATHTTFDWEDSDNEDEDWGEIEEITEPKLPDIRQKKNLCWECCQCNTINNLMVSMTKYKGICYGCNNEIYVDGITHLKYKLHWDSPDQFYVASPVNKQLLKEKVLKRVKFWVCDICTLYNKMYTFKCKVCGHKRTNKTIDRYTNVVSGWTCYQCSSENKDTEFCIKCNNPRIPELLSWSCMMCSCPHGMKEKHLTECKHCGYKKPTQFHSEKYLKKVELMISGYCQTIISLKEFRFPNIPTYIQQIICVFYIERNRESQTITNKKDSIYVWKYKIVSKKNNIPSNETVNISIGLVGINDNWEKHILNETSRKQQKYCPPIKCNDIITMELNYIDQTLSYAINKKWFGHFAYIDKTERYRTQINVYSRSHGIHIINLTIFPQFVIFPKSTQRKIENHMVSQPVQRKNENHMVSQSVQIKNENHMVPIKTQEKLDDLKKDIISILSRNGKINSKLAKSVMNTNEETHLLLVLMCLKSHEETLKLESSQNEKTQNTH